ncbi:metallophosphoesterase family protein [Candidatus Woesearchaeota archaeon]|nr:metallophosphoesterase family protein [Candidatus Woesearchaeota archaeon]
MAAATTMKKQKIIKNTKLRILAFSDLHGSEAALKILARKAKKADAIVCAGDFTVFEHNILRIMRKIDSLGKPVMLVNGNHEDPALVREICIRLKNTTFAHRGICHRPEFPDYAFIGHGGEGFTHTSEDFERFATAAKSKIRQLQKQEKKIIFVTHQPPHKTKLDYIWAHHGSKSYTTFDKKWQPALHVCGHLHETQGKTDRIGKTLAINPGPKGEIVET